MPKSALGKKKSVLIIILVIVVAGIVFAITRGSGTKYQFVAVKQGTITETVNVSGNTTPVQSIDLGFQNGGTIAAVTRNVGDHVAAGDVIAAVNTSDLRAQLAQAQASVDQAQAQLQSLQAGAQPADIQASQAALAKGNQDLANFYGNVPSTLLDALAKASDAVRNQLASFFSGAETNNPQLTFSVTNSQTLNNMQTERMQMSTELNTWQQELVMASSSSMSTSSLEAMLQTGNAHLTVITQFLATASEALIEATNLSATTASTYKTSLASAISEVSTATANVTMLAQNIASQKFTVAQLQAQLNLKLAGSTPQQIAAQQAQVEQAQANLQGIQVKITEATLTSPIDGVITVQNAKVGQIAAPGTTLVSIISNDNFEVDANIPETDIGKIALNDSVTMTFDAFPNETFSGKVFYIDPAETLVQGVVDYKIKVSFNLPDPRIKSGLTANLDIQTQQKNNALILPQFAILQNDQGNFVETLENGAVKQNPVTLGIRDDQGNVEIFSGATAGEQVLNIGLKQ